MADEADEAPVPPVKKAGGGIVGVLLRGLGVFVLALGAVVLGGFVNSKLFPPPALKLGKDGLITVYVPPAPAGHADAPGTPKNTVYLPIDPPLVVNFEDGSVVRFLQITMEIAGRDQKVIDSVQKNLPLIRNNLLLVMSNRNYQALMSREGKEKLRQEALAEIRSVQKKEGGEDVDDVLFTSFVVQ